MTTVPLRPPTVYRVGQGRVGPDHDYHIIPIITRI